MFGLVRPYPGPDEAGQYYICLFGDWSGYGLNQARASRPRFYHPIEDLAGNIPLTSDATLCCMAMGQILQLEGDAATFAEKH